MTQLEQLAAVVTEQLSSSLPPPRTAEQNQIIVMIKKATYSAFIIGYKTGRDSVAKDLFNEKLLSEEQFNELLQHGEAELNPLAKAQPDETK